MKLLAVSCSLSPVSHSARMAERLVATARAGGDEAESLDLRMALSGLAGSLMLDFRCLIVPRFVYASRESFAEGRLRDPDVESRLDVLATELRRIALAVRG